MRYRNLFIIRRWTLGGISSTFGVRISKSVLDSSSTNAAVIQRTGTHRKSLLCTFLARDLHTRTAAQLSTRTLDVFLKAAACQDLKRESKDRFTPTFNGVFNMCERGPRGLGYSQSDPV